MLDMAIATTILAISAAQPAQAVCAPRESLLSSLDRQYAEAPRELGLADNGMVIELITSRDGRTWTLLVTRPDGTSCVVAAGEAWEPMPQSLAGRPL